MSAALEYHRATNVEAGGTDEAPQLDPATRPMPFKDYGEAERIPLDTSIAGPLLQDGAGIVRSQPGRDYGGGTMHWRAYSSAGGLFPVEAYVAAPDGLFSFDVLSRALVRIGGGDSRAQVADQAGVDADAEVFVVLTGIHARTGWKYQERGYRHVWWDAGTMLANLLALAAASGLQPRLYTAFVDADVNELLGLDGRSEYALALLELRGGNARESGPSSPSNRLLLGAAGPRYPLAERAYSASSFSDVEAARRWRTAIEDEEPRLDRTALVRAIRRRGSVRHYSEAPLPRAELAELLAWSEAPIPGDAPPAVRQLVPVAAVEGLEPGIYDAGLNLLDAREERELRERASFAAMEQGHPREAAVNVFQLSDLEGVVARLGDRGYRWAQLEAGIRVGRLQIGAFMRGWGAAASTFYDDEVSRLLETDEESMLMVAVGPR